MASISTSIELYDKVSAPIYKMLGALGNLTSAFESVETSMDGGFDSSKIEEARRKTEQAALEVVQLGNEIEENERSQQGFNEKVRQGASGMDGLVKKVMGLAGAYMSIQSITNFISSAMEGSNMESSIVAQLKNVLKNVGATKGAFEELQEESMQFESEGMYGAAEMLAGAGELATYISDTDAIKSMMGTLADYAAGMSGGGALSSDQIVEYGTQLGKALMGTYDGLKKKGFELTDIQKEIIDGTATHAEIAEELGMTIEEVTSMSEDMHKALVLDSVIAESWDGLYESMSNTPEGKIAMLQNAWGDVMDSVGYQLTPVVMDLFDAIRDNMPEIKNFILNATALLGGLISVIGFVADVVGFLADNWSIIEPILLGIAAALALVNAPLIAQAGLWLWNSVLVPAYNAVLTFLSIGYGVLRGNTAAASAAQIVYNNALLACPLTWILLIIIAVIAAIYAVVAAINKVTGSTTSATGVIVGALMAAVAFIWNLFLGLLDLVLAIINHFYNKFIMFANFFANLFKDPIGSVIHLFGDMADSVLGVLESIAKAMDKIFGSNMAGTIQGWRSGLDSMVEQVANKHGNGAYEKVANEINLSSESLGLKRWEYADAYNTGYSWGEGIDDSVSGMFDSFSGDSLGDLGGYDGYDASQIPSNIADTAGNTGAMKDSMDITSEDLKYLRDLAETEVVNRFTTAEIKVEMTNNNNVSSDMDLDGMVDYLATGVNEAMERAAEGVHE